MISAIRFDDRGIHYRNRYVATENYRDETRAGHIVNRGFGKQRPGGMLGNAFRQPANVSNTSVVMQGDRLLSLWEGGPPFALDPATLDTRGVETFGGTVKAFSAHPKVDPDTGELFNFGIDYGAKTTLTPYRIDKGVVTRLPPVTLPHAIMNHDFVLTTRYLAFCLGPIILWTPPFVLGRRSFDRALFWDSRMPTIDPARAARRKRQDRASSKPTPSSSSTSPTASRRTARWFSTWRAIPTTTRSARRCATTGSRNGRAHGMASLTRMRIDLATGKVESRTYDSGTANEFPCINPAYVGKRQRYAYIACNPPTARWACSSSSPRSISRPAP